MDLTLTGIVANVRDGLNPRSDLQSAMYPIIIKRPLTLNLKIDKMPGTQMYINHIYFA